MKWHVGSGSVSFDYESNTVDEAFVAALKSFPLHHFNQFMYGFEEGGDIYAPDTWWG